MKNNLRSLSRIAAASIALAASHIAMAGTDIWTGGGGSSNTVWQSGANWFGGNVPAAGDELVFTNAISLTSSNNYTAGTIFGGITFANPAGAFVLNGRLAVLTNNITDNQPVTSETITMPIQVNSGFPLTVTTVPNAVVNLNGQISGAGNVATAGSGLVNLNSTNTFTGVLTIGGGTVVVSTNVSLAADDTVLGAAPGSATPGSLVINGGTLLTSSNMTINPNRGIALGPTSGSGQGAISINTINNNITVKYGGIMANNGSGAGGLTKLGFGALTLFGANTYTGTTSNEVGTLNLDFTQGTPPSANIISPSSPLSLGGANAGGGETNFAQLNLIGGSTSDSQTFNGTHLTFGGSIIAASSTGGSTLALGAISHDPGGTVVFSPPTATGGTGNITTTSTNLNGILGGWATISGNTFQNGNLVGTNWASVDGSGNIINFPLASFFTYPGTNFTDVNNPGGFATLHSLVNATTTGVETNVLIDPTGAQVVMVDNPGAGTLTDVNSIKFSGNPSSALPAGTTQAIPGDALCIAAGNTLRLGVYGGIMKQDTIGADVYVGGTNNNIGLYFSIGVTNSQDVGTLTAGGPNNNTPGEIVVTQNANSETTGTISIPATITDNGSGAVTVVKTGPGSIKLGGHNTFSGGLYLLQGRVQWDGSEVGTNAPTNNIVGNLNPAGGGSGSTFVLPGAYLFLNSTTPAFPCTNSIFIAGTGDSENIGALRGGVFIGTTTLIGDADIAGSAVMLGPITGPFNLYLGSFANSGGAGATICSTNNSWTGNTIMTAQIANNKALNIIVTSNNEVIPNGFGKGNLILQAGAAGGVGGPGGIAWNMNGFSETVNGLSSVGVIASITGGVTATTNCIIENLSPNPSTLTVGDNDQSALFGGVISNMAGSIALIKIGAGVETLTNKNTYVGNTTISNGVLQLTGVGSIANSPQVNIFGGAFDISQINGFSIGGGQAINVAGGTLLASLATSSGAVNFTNGTLQITSVSGGGDGSGTANLTVSTLNVDTAGGFVKVANTPRVSAFPVEFPVIHYTTFGGSGRFGALIPSGYGGYVTNVTATTAQFPTANTLYLVLTNGPLTPVVTWKGLNGVSVAHDWDLITPDWLSNSTPVDYVDGAIARFVDSPATGLINITTINGSGPAPGDTIVSNNVTTYTFSGPGGIGGTNHVFKQGPGTLILDNSGADTYNGALSSAALNISAGTVQLGINDTGGSLSAGSVANNGMIIFDRANSDLIVTNQISGSGSLSNSTATTLTLSGANAIGGSIGIITGSILQAGNNSSLGATNVIPSGASLDVNGKNLGAEQVTVSGMGVLSLDGTTNGAIYNSSATAASPALARVTLTGPTVFGGALDDSGLTASSLSNRWDLRAPGGTTGDPGTASLLTDGGTYKITKIGNNFVGIVSATVSPNIGDIDIQGGTLDMEGNTTGLGNPANTLTVESPATFEMYSATNRLNKNIVVNNNGSIVVGQGANNTIIGAMALNGQANVTVGGNGTLTLNDALGGTGVLNYNGTNTLIVSGTDSHSGGTIVNGGTFLLNTISSSPANVLSNVFFSTIGGNGTNKGPVLVQGTIFPGAGGKPSTFGVGGLLEMDPFSGPVAEFSLGSSTAPGGGVNDLININGNLDANGNVITINEVGPLQNGTYTLINYSGALSSSFSRFANKTVNPTRYTYTLTQGSGVVALQVTGAATQLEWNNLTGDGLWNVAASSNWLNQTTSAQDIFDQLDPVVLDDSIGGQTNIVTINTNSAASTTNNSVTPGVLLVNNSSVNYVINGPGGIVGGSSIVKQGSSTLTINNANAFTGTTTISNGILLINNTNALGGVNNAIIVTNGGTLDIGGASFTANLTPLLGTKPIFIAGMGVNNKGAIINSGGVAQEDGLQNITLTADAAIGGDGIINGAGRFDIGRLSPNSFSTGGHPYNLTKVGTNQVSFVNLAVDSALGNIDIQGGMLGFEIGTTFGDPAHTLTIESGATLEFFETTNTLNKPLTVNGGALAQGIYPNVFFNGGGVPNNSISGPVTITNGLVVIGGGASGTISNVISGPSALRIAGPVFLDATNTYTGFTGVSNNGTLFLVGTASIGQSTNITLEGIGAKIDVSGRANGTLTLAGQKLRGFGTINGTLTNNADGTVSPGTNNVTGTLVVTNNATLLGLTLMKLDAGNATNDVLSVGGKLTYGGTLTVTNISATALTVGQSYQLFNVVTTNGGSFSGSFSTLNLPTLTAGLTWNTSNLAINGTLSITSSGAGTFSTPPGSLTFSINGANVTIHGTGGQSGDAYYLLVSTNVALPLSQWTVVATNVLGANGNFTFNGTNVVTPGDQQQFYILSNTNSNHQ